MYRPFWIRNIHVFIIDMFRVAALPGTRLPGPCNKIPTGSRVPGRVISNLKFANHMQAKNMLSIWVIEHLQWEYGSRYAGIV